MDEDGGSFENIVGLSLWRFWYTTVMSLDSRVVSQDSLGVKAFLEEKIYDSQTEIKVMSTGMN